MGRPLIPLLDLTRQVRKIQPELERAVRRVLLSGNYVLGPEVARFEKEFARFCSTAHAVGVASGTDALELALKALGIKPGDIVATVSFTFIATADAILHVGATPLFVDIDPATYTMDPSDLGARIEALSPAQKRRLKAIIPVHLYGHPCDMDKILRIAKKHRLAVIEDAAQAAGAAWKGKPVGSLGDAGCFSFFPTKNLGGCGDGGIITTRSARLAQKIRLLRVHGRRGREFQVELGRNSRLDELQAAILRVKLRKLRAWISRRRSLAKQFSREVSGLPGLTPPMEKSGTKHAFHLYVLRSDDRKAVQRKLAKFNITTQVYYSIPVHLQPIHRKANRSLRLPETEKASREVFSVPLYPEMTSAEQLRICRALRDR